MGIIHNLISLALIGAVASQSIPIGEYKQLLLDESNEFRRKPSATNMANLQWDDTLASEAAQWISGCRFEHTPDLKRGENLAYSSDTGDNEAMIREALQAWYDEVNQYNYAGKECGSSGSCHYTQMVWAKTRKVGCAIQKCASLSTGMGSPLANAWYLGCFYDPKGNYVDEYPYEQGASCSKCLEGQKCEKKLCAGEGKEPCLNKDGDDQCMTWADAGQCQSNAAFMDRACAKACEKCKGEPGTGSSGGDCTDKLGATQCEGFKFSCESNKGYMRLNCKKTCGLC